MAPDDHTDVDQMILRQGVRVRFGHVEKDDEGEVKSTDHLYCASKRRIRCHSQHCEDSVKDLTALSDYDEQTIVTIVIV